MKNLILGIVFLISFNAFSEELPSACREVGQKISDYAGSASLTTSLSYQYPEVREAVIKVIDLLNKIVALKFSAVNFLMKNRQLYGRYQSGLGLKNDLEKRRHEVDVIRRQIEEQYQASLRGINPQLSERMQRKMMKQISKAYKREIEVNDEEQERLRELLTKASKKYFKALKAWSPFQDYVDHLAVLEKELLFSLDQIAKAGQIGQETLTPVASKLQLPWRSSEAEQVKEYCLSLDKGFAEFQTKLEAFRP